MVGFEFKLIHLYQKIIFLLNIHDTQYQDFLPILLNIVNNVIIISLFQEKWDYHYAKTYLLGITMVKNIY